MTTNGFLLSFDKAKTLIDLGILTIFHHVISKWGGTNDDEMEVIDSSTSQYVDTLLIEETVNKNLKPNMNFFSKFGGRVCYANRPYFYILSLDRKLRKCTFTDEKNSA